MTRSQEVAVKEVYKHYVNYPDRFTHSESRFIRTLYHDYLSRSIPSAILTIGQSNWLADLWRTHVGIPQNRKFVLPEPAAPSVFEDPSQISSPQQAFYIADSRVDGHQRQIQLLFAENSRRKLKIEELEEDIKKLYDMKMRLYNVCVLLGMEIDKLL